MTDVDLRLLQLRADVYSEAAEFNRALGDYFTSLRRGDAPEEKKRMADAVRRRGESYLAALDALVAHLHSLPPGELDAGELERTFQFKELAVREMDLAR